MSKRIYTQYELQAHLFAVLSNANPRHQLKTCRMCKQVEETGRKCMEAKEYMNDVLKHSFPPDVNCQVQVIIPDHLINKKGRKL